MICTAFNVFGLLSSPHYQERGYSAMLQVRGVRGKRVGASWEKMYHSRIVELGLSFKRASRSICNFICGYSSKTFESLCRKSCVNHLPTGRMANCGGVWKYN